MIVKLPRFKKEKHVFFFGYLHPVLLEQSSVLTNRLLCAHVCHIQPCGITCHKMNLCLSCICLWFLAWCCFYSLLSSKSNITYCVDPPRFSKVSLYICSFIVFCSYLYYSTTYFNYLFLYLCTPLNCEVLLERDSIFIIFLLPEAVIGTMLDDLSMFAVPMNKFSSNQQNLN